MKTLLAFAALAISSARAEFNMATPAHLRVTVVDPAGRPVSGASVILSGGAGEANPTFVTLTTDAQGEASSVLSPRPAAMIVTRPGYADWRWGREGNLGLFPSAEITRRVVLIPSGPTVINFQKPDGSPLPYVVFNLHERENTLVLTPYIADADGAYRFTIDEDASLFNVPPALPTIRRVVRGSTSVVRFTPEEASRVPTAKPVEGTVLLPDGKPAAGWIIAWLVTTMHTGWSVETGAGRGVETKEDILAPAEFQVLPSNGSFSFHTYGDYVALISPEGIPYRYPTPTAEWPAGTHRLDLRVPAAPPPIRGRIEFEDGAPAAGISLSLYGIQPLGAEVFWRFRPHQRPSSPRIPAPVFKTAPDGSFILPAYPGGDPRYNVEQGFDIRRGEVAKGGTVTIRRSSAAPTWPKKHVLAQFVDERGQPIPNFAEQITNYIDVSSGTRRDVGAASDSRGVHFFVPTDGASIVLSPKRPGLSSVRQTIPLTSADDQAVRVTIPDSQRNLPLSGVLLDPDGDVVPGATVFPFANSTDGSSGREFFGMSTKTDAQGRFSFESATDTGGLNIIRYDDIGTNPTLPGNLPPATFTRDQRTLTIRLTRK